MDIQYPMERSSDSQAFRHAGAHWAACARTCWPSGVGGPRHHPAPPTPVAPAIPRRWATLPAISDWFVYSQEYTSRHRPSLTGASTERLDTCGAAPWPPGARSAIWQLATLETHPRTRGARTRLSVASEVSWVQVGATWRAALLAAYGSSRAAGSGASSARLAQVCSHAGCVLRHVHGWSLSNFSCGFVSPSECHGRCPAR